MSLPSRSRRSGLAEGGINQDAADGAHGNEDEGKMVGAGATKETSKTKSSR
jgi:hypothetical protein